MQIKTKKQGQEESELQREWKQRSEETNKSFKDEEFPVIQSQNLISLTSHSLSGNTE